MQARGTSPMGPGWRGLAGCLAAVCGLAAPSCGRTDREAIGTRERASDWREDFGFRVAHYDAKGSALVVCLELSGEPEAVCHDVLGRLRRVAWAEAVRAAIVVRDGIREEPARDARGEGRRGLLETLDPVEAGKGRGGVQAALSAALRRANRIARVPARVLYIPCGLRDEDGRPISETGAESVRKTLLTENYCRIPIDVMPLRPNEIDSRQRLFLCYLACESGGRCLD